MQNDAKRRRGEYSFIDDEAVLNGDDDIIVEMKKVTWKKKEITKKT